MNHEELNQMTTVQLQDFARELKKQKNCYVIAHNYQDVAVQQIADYVGDGLQMAQVAAETDAEKIFICGIKIMAETAKVLNPNRQVLMSHPTADCRLANMESPDALLRLKAAHPHAEVICYVNSPAALKAESTITCTSANAVEIVAAMPRSKPLIFVPDSNIGAWASYRNDRPLIMFGSYCYVHHQISLEQVLAVRRMHPDHSLLVHPECRLEVCKEADLVCSTSQMIDFVSTHDKVIIGTEIGLYEQLKFHYPEKDLVPLSPAMSCEDMKKTTLRGAVEALMDEAFPIIVPDDIMRKTQRSLNRMLSFL
jgi:quinolinate synthase